MNVSGLDDVKMEVQKLRERYGMYTVFHIPNLDPVTYKVVKKDGKDMKSELKTNYDERTLRKIFLKCVEDVREDFPCYIVYDFVFYDKDLWRNTFCFISYIPDTLNIKKKVVYSTNALRLIEALDIPLHISFTKMDELTYDEVKERCSKFRSK
ncbi:hypothetical protein NCER_100589 [Vairimorpha ceranae BRL01]|uniref:ADF-H domain-containing protein n=2 Tax=Vairimorpha ceranae TaxID=40302 RepID=C4V7Z1_VAIC1|nr:adf actin-binding protein [Vairimorpha ceranae]EEQ82658.1 hypothetical protein NCER_100589 [Vairimorpha ceranae BRL01]KAF5141152.1 hypothetical protein G9O61_00g004680 [Vairimorpha ceranae]KKO75955.1 adf actin-binding protein [Vairimorpha ceranae]